MKLDDLLKYDSDGLICAVIQHHETGQVLMVGYMNRESLGITIKEKKACFWSRSRQTLWLKGETSGNVLHVKEMRIDFENWRRRGRWCPSTRKSWPILKRPFPRI